MASNFTPVNPKYLGNANGVSNSLTVDRDAVDSKTWKAGELGHVAAGTGKVQPNTTTTGAKIAEVQFMKDQDTSTSSSTVAVKTLQRGDQFEMYVTSNGTDNTIGVANIGTRYGVYTKSNVTYLDVNDSASGADFKVIKVAAAYEPERNLAADTPGKCIVEYDPIA